MSNDELRNRKPGETWGVVNLNELTQREADKAAAIEKAAEREREQEGNDHHS